MLAQPGFTLTDGAYVRFKTHVALKGSAVTLNVNGTGAQTLLCANGSPPILGANRYVTAVYNSNVGAMGGYQYLSDSVPYVTGTYTGGGSDEAVTVTLGFMPDAVIVKSCNSATTSTGMNSAYLALYRYPAKNGLTSSAVNVLEIHSGGFEANLKSNVGPNQSGTTYYYIAFR